MRLVEDVRILARTPGFLRILGVRLVSQTGDGMFQAGLATLFFFSPQAMTDAPGVALAIIVMLLPYSLVGPFVGPFLDHWKRRSILWYGNLARAVCVAIAALAMAMSGVGPVVYVVALVVLGLSRFLLAGLSAGLPRILDNPERLLMANSIVPTMGGVATGAGAVIGFLLRLALPAGTAQDLMALGLAAMLYVAAGFVALSFGIDDLGPDVSENSGTLGAQLRQAGLDLAEAVRYLVRRGRPAAALSVMALHRLVYGFELVSVILISRNLLAAPEDADAGLARFGLLAGCLAAGYVAAVVLTPIAHERIAPSQWIVICLLGGSLGQLGIVASARVGALAVGLFVFGVGAQGAKIAVDTIVQEDTADDYRGRAFTLYDVLFNVAECVAAALCVVILPDSGYSRLLQGLLVLFIWAVAAWFALVTRRLHDRPRPA